MGMKPGALKEENQKAHFPSVSSSWLALVTDWETAAASSLNTESRLTRLLGEAKTSVLRRRLSNGCGRFQVDPLSSSARIWATAIIPLT